MPAYRATIADASRAHAAAGKRYPTIRAALDSIAGALQLDAAELCRDRDQHGAWWIYAHKHARALCPKNPRRMAIAVVYRDDE